MGSQVLWIEMCATCYVSFLSEPNAKLRVVKETVPDEEKADGYLGLSY